MRPISCFQVHGGDVEARTLDENHAACAQAVCGRSNLQRAGVHRWIQPCSRVLSDLSGLGELRNRANLPDNKEDIDNLHSSSYFF